MSRSYISALIFAIAMVITAIVLGNAIKNRNKPDGIISVTGLGEKNFESDLIVWRGSFNKKSFDLKSAYAELDQDREKIRKYLISKGIQQGQIVFTAVDINKEFDYEYDQYGGQRKQVFTGYLLTQTVQIESNDVNKVEDVSRQVSELINSGVEFYSNPPQYYYTKLGALKIEMIAEATKDANIRAKKIAENSDSKVGNLKSADLGVFQITAQNSSEEYSWGGTFNTASKRKTASITVRLEYEVD